MTSPPEAAPESRALLSSPLQTWQEKRVPESSHRTVSGKAKAANEHIFVMRVDHHSSFDKYVSLYHVSGTCLRPGPSP